MEISKGYITEDYNKLDLSNHQSTDWNTATKIFINRMEPRYLVPIRLMMKEDAKIINIRERKFGFAITALICLLIETLHCFRNGIIDNRGQASHTFEVFLTTSKSFSNHFDNTTARVFYDHIRNGILHQAETKEGSRIRDIGPVIRKLSNGIAINRSLLFELLEEEFHYYVDEISDPSNTALRNSFKTKMDHICQ